jgi:hypothetical protein
MYYCVAGSNYPAKDLKKPFNYYTWIKISIRYRIFRHILSRHPWHPGS